jgi:hypothetical protein
LSSFFLYYYYSSSFDVDATTFYKKGVARKKTIFFVSWILAIAYYCCKAFELLLILWLLWNKLKEKYARKMSTTKMSYLWVCHWCTTSLNAPSYKVNIMYIFVGGGWSMAHNNLSTWLVTFTLLVRPFSLYHVSNPPKAKWTRHRNIA